MYFEEGFANPLLASRTFRQAWGERWNRTVGLLLKRTIYIPARQDGNLPAFMAALLTFLASGALHEYNFSVHNGAHYYQQDLGKALIFFGTMGIWMLVEESVFRTCLPRRTQAWIQDKLPTAVISISLSLLFAAGPFELFFIKSWFQAGMVETLSHLFPIYQCS